MNNTEPEPAGPTEDAPIVIEVYPAKVWIESDFNGARHVMVQHQAHNQPFKYASFFYNYAYTDNAGTWKAAERLALALGAAEPVEHRTVPLGEQIKALCDSGEIPAISILGITSGRGRPASAAGANDEADPKSSRQEQR